MNLIFKIAKNELRNLFYSPVAWFLAIVFLIQCGIYYTYAIFPQAKWQDIAIANNPKFRDLGFALTPTVFLSLNGIMVNALGNLYLFVPLLTMGLISREVSTGTIKLLYSSPVKVRQIVLGKYLATMIYNLLLVGIIAIFVVMGFFNIRNLDYGLLLSALLGFYLLVCAYAAIGMFMSSLTTYQIVSAISTFLVIFMLSQVGTLWQKYDFVRDLTYFLSINGRTFKLLLGLITTKDLIYFIVIVCMFVCFTIIKLRSGCESKPWFIAASRYFAIFVAALVIGYVSSRPALIGYWDISATQRNTLHPNTQKIVKQFGKEPLEITLYSNLLAPGLKNTLPENRNAYLSTVWEQYIRFKPDITFKYVYYYKLNKGDSTYYNSFPHKSLKQIAENIADGFDTRASLFETPEAITRTIDLSDERYRSVMQLKYKGRTTFLRTFNDPQFWPDEMLIAAAFKRLLQHPMPKIYYISGNLERGIYKAGEREYQLHSIEKGYRNSLLNLGFDADTLSLDHQDIPVDASTLVLGDPKTELSETTRNKIKDYIAAGGNMLILSKPGKQAIVNPVLKALGVQYMPGTVVEPTVYEMPQMVNAFLTINAANLADDDMMIRLREDRKEKITTDSLRMLMPGVTAISTAPNCPFTVKPIAVTTASRTWLKQGVFATDSAQIVYNPQKGDVRGAYSTIVQLTRNINKKEQRIIVCGDADFLSNSRVQGDLIGVPMLSWLHYNKFPSYTPGSKPKDNLILISAKVANAQIIVFVWVLPALVLISGAVLLIRRKRK
jgi:ABC-2 type transport system permease protein